MVVTAVAAVPAANVQAHRQQQGFHRIAASRRGQQPAANTHTHTHCELLHFGVGCSLAKALGVVAAWLLLLLLYTVDSTTKWAGTIWHAL
jgi:hypothetical protein